MKKTLTNLEIANIMAYVNSEDSISKNTTMKFTMEFVWKFRKNIKRLSDAQEIFKKLQEDIMQYYATDEYSYIDEEGNRLVKNEYVDEYGQKMNDLYLQENKIEIDTVKIEKLCVGGLEGMDKIGLSVPELEVLSFMIDDSFMDEEEPIEEVENIEERENNEDNEVLTGEVE